jgi:hypothetical protein
MTSLIPSELPISLAAAIVGKCPRDFRSKVLKPGLVQLTARHRVCRISLGQWLGYAVSTERFLAAHARREPARAAQRAYRANLKLKDASHVTV